MTCHRFGEGVSPRRSRGEAGGWGIKPTLRWGILSTARIADQLVRAIRLSSNGELVAVASRDLERARAWARERNVPHAFGSYDAMLESDVIDAVYIPLPNSLHKEWTVRAASRGKHVLCEKPLASNAAEVEEIIRAAEANHVYIMEAFMYRFHPQMQRVRELVAGGSIGELKVIRATFGFYLNRADDVRWRADLAGGALMDVGCYCVNVSRMFADEEPVAAQASGRWTGDGGKTEGGKSGGVDDLLASVLEFPGGVLGVVDCSFRTHSRQWLGLSGTRGDLGLTAPFRIDEEPGSIIYEHDGKMELIRTEAANEYERMVTHFGEMVLNGGNLAYSLQNSLGQMRAIDALYESARTGKKVEIKR